MLIDATHKKWMVATVVGLGVATVAYLVYAAASPYGASGGSPMGLAYGIVGYAMMIFAGLLGVRKKFPVWRVGRAQTWLRGHLWLGLLSFPLILFHSGFIFGGLLTTLLMWLFIVVTVSGVLGAALQHFLPRLMTLRVPMETIYEQIDSVRGQLIEEADQVVAAMCGPLETGAPAAKVTATLLPVTLHSAAAPAVATAPALTSAGPAGTMAGGPAGAAVLEVEESASQRLHDFYQKEVRPFLYEPAVGGHPLAEAKRAEAVFKHFRTLLPPALHPAVDDLENICEEERQLTRQARLHRWLHLWLLVHIPISIALLVLGAVHAWKALSY